MEEVVLSEWRSLQHLAREPLYNTRAVVQTTGVPADTFRAWERRYSLPRPYRTSSNQRLYSERDIGLISWLRDRTGEGMTISQAIQRLRLEYPDLLRDVPPPKPVAPASDALADPQATRLQQRLIDAVTVFDGQAGERVIDEALALFTVEAFCSRIVEPVLYEVGERWSRNELGVTAEHFATRLIARRLATIFNLTAPATGRGTIVAACPAGEEHEIGLLVLAIFLARRNWRVVYLGANVPTTDLVVTVRQIRPDLVCLSAATRPSADQAVAVARQLLATISPPPAVALGGRAIDASVPMPILPGLHYLAGGAHEIADRIAGLVEQPQRRGR